MSENDPNRTVPRQNTPAPEQTIDHVPADDTNDCSLDASSPASPSGTPGAGSTAVRSPDDLARLETTARDIAAEGVPGYVLLSELGRGGMGVVYKARHVKLNRVVALKMMLGSDRARPDDLTRFLAEAEAVAAVRHENVVQVYEYGEADGCPYMALEFCPGGTLAGLLARDRKSVGSVPAARDAARILAQVARGVAAAHARGIVHRDLKPGNVFLDESGVPKVADFGLVKRGDRSEMTRTGQVMGTPAYMSPEQAKGESKFVGPPADVWALGVMLYQALTGVRPFTAENPLELMLQIAVDDPAPPRAVVPAVPRDLELICLKCLAKRPGERYPTAKELADDLDRYLNHMPISVRPAGPFERAYKRARRNKVATAALAVGAAAAVALAGLLVSIELNNALKSKNESVGKQLDETTGVLGEEKKLHEKTEAERIAAEIKQKEEEAKRIAAEIKQNEEKRRRLEKENDVAAVKYYDQLLRVNKILKTEPSTGMKLLLDETLCPPNRREVAWGVLYRLCKRDYLTLPDAKASAIAVSHDSKTLAVGTTGPKPTVRLLDIATGQERKSLTGHTGVIRAVAYSANGKVLASAGSDGTIRLWNSDTGAPGRVLKVPAWTEGVWSLAVSPDGRLLAAGRFGHPFNDRRPSDIKLWNLQNEGEPVALTGHAGPVGALVFAPDGKTLASAAPDATVRLWDVPAGRLRLTLKHTDASWVTSVAFGKSGETVAAGNVNGNVKVWTVAGKEVKHWSGNAAGIYGLAVSADGTTLATAHEGGGVDDRKQVKLWNPETGALIFALDMNRQRIDSVAFSPDGSVLVGADADGVVRLWRMKQTDEDLAFNAHGFGYAVAYSPDGKTLATGGGLRGASGEAKLWDARTGALRRTLGGHTGKVTALAYTPDGTVLATASEDGTIKLWDPSTGAERRTVALHLSAVRCVAFSPDGRLAASAGLDNIVRVWDPATGAERFPLVGHTGWVTAVAFSPDGRTLASAGFDTTIRFWDLADGREKARWEAGADNGVFSLAFASNGETLYTGEATTVRAWAVSTGKVLFTGRGHTHWVTGVAPSRDGRTLATGSLDGSVKLWDMTASREILTFHNPLADTRLTNLLPGKLSDKAALFLESGLKAIALSPDGRELAGIGIDGKLRIWR